FRAVRGNALIYVHKERELPDVAARYPADHYVLVDDKLRILAAVKAIWRERVTTVFVRQAHYARDRSVVARFPAADVTIDRIGDLLKFSRETFSSVGTSLPTRPKRAPAGYNKAE